MSSPRVSRPSAARVLVGVAVLVVAASVGTAGAQTGDPIVFDVAPSAQTTAPSTPAAVTFTVSDRPPCRTDDLTTLDSLDVALTDPSGQSTINPFPTTSEPPGSVNSTLLPDGRTLSLLFDSALPCNARTTESISVAVTVNVPATVPSGTQLTLDGVARGFAVPANDDYLLQRTATVLVQTPPPSGSGGRPAGVPPVSTPPVSTPPVSTPPAGVPRFAGR